MHHAFNKAQSYSGLEISLKLRSKNVLIPEVFILD